MSRWEQDKTIESEFSPDSGELMLSASDVIAWLRWCSVVIEPPHVYTPAIIAVADSLASNCLDATRALLDRGDS